MANAPAECETSYSGGRNDAACRCQAEGVGCVVDITPQAATLRTNCPRSGIDAHASHPAKINDYAPVTRTQAATIMAAAAYCQRYVILASEVYCSDHVGNVRTLGDYPGSLIDHCVIYLAGLFI